MRFSLKTLALAAALAFVAPTASLAPAFAQEVVTKVEAAPPVIASTPEAVTAAKEDTSVTIEWGNMLNYAVKTVSGVLSVVILGALTWGATFIPGIAGVGARMMISRLGEKFIQNITDYAINAVEGATKDKKLTVDVGSKVVASAINRAVTLENEDKFLKWLMAQLGGAQGIGEKVFRKIDIEAGANKQNVLNAGVQMAGKPYPLNRG